MINKQVETSRNIPNILIVDDIGANLKLLNDILITKGIKSARFPVENWHCRWQKQKSPT